MRKPVARALLGMVLALGPAVSAAQTTATGATSGFQDGFFIQSGDGDHRLLFGAVVQMDGRFVLDTPPSTIDTFTMRKVRPTVSGRVARYFDFKLMPDFGNGTAVVLDAYLDIRFSPRLRVRSGKDKAPVGYELLIGDAFLLFPERSLVSGLVPNRDVGIQAQGDLWPWLYYAAGVFNGVPDGASSSTDLDANSGKDVAGRVVVRAPGGLGFQLGASAGSQQGALPVFRTSVGQTYFSYASGVGADGHRTRVTPALFFYRGPVGLFAEYVSSQQRVSRAGNTQRVTNRGWDVTASYLATGETAGVTYTRPRSPFDPSASTWGALQFVARYAAVDFDDVATTARLAARGSAESARQVSAGVNWYATAYVRAYFTYERTVFDTGIGTERPDEDVILFRLQLGI